MVLLYFLTLTLKAFILFFYEKPLRFIIFISGESYLVLRQTRASYVNMQTPGLKWTEERTWDILAVSWEHSWNTDMQNVNSKIKFKNRL